MGRSPRATRERQKAWLALAADPDQTPPPPWQLKAWLLGGAEIATTAALFDEALYHSGIVSDHEALTVISPTPMNSGVCRTKPSPPNGIA
ncbi:MAG: hypothetical protein SH859_11890 [Hyphomicrobium aestuarii]|nr:hypothetical protein [Hyphomicrobium aestuarii]